MERRKDEAMSAPPSGSPSSRTILRASERLAEPDSPGVSRAEEWVGRLPQRPTPAWRLRGFEVGDRIDNTYEVKAILGEGGMGAVYLVHHDGWDLDLAIKIPRSDLLAYPAGLKALVREAEAWTNLGIHPHIAYCFYVHPLDGVPLLVVEYVNGGNLQDWIAENQGSDLKAGLNVAIQLCHGLEHAHANGIIHRDVKPNNVLLGEHGTIKVTDFGISRILEGGAGENDESAAGGSPEDDQTLGALGTPEYMPPEQWDGSELDPTADIFSLGVCLYVLWCGRRPYEPFAAGEPRPPLDPRELITGLPERLPALMKRCVAWERAERPGDTAEIRAELSSIHEELFGEPSAWAELPSVSLEADGCNNRGVSYIELGKEEQALDWLNKALERNPHHVEATYNQALLQWRRAEIDDEEALRRVDQAAHGLTANGRDVALARARLHVERGDPQGVREASACFDGLYEAHFGLHDATGITRLATRIEPRGTVATSADGRRLLSAAKGELALWDLEMDERIRTVEAPSISGNNILVVLSGNGHRALTVDYVERLASSIEVWDMEAGRHLWTLSGHADGVKSLALNADGSLGVSSSLDETLRLWHLETGKCLKTLEDKSFSVAISSDGRWALSGADPDGTARLWDLEAGCLAQTIEIPGKTWPNESPVSITADGRLALLGDREGMIKVYQVEVDERAEPTALTSPLRTLAGHGAGVTTVCLSTDGRLALSGSWDGTAKLWELTTGRCLHTFVTLESFGLKAELVDGGKAAVFSDKDSLQVWRIGALHHQNQPYALSRPQRLEELRALNRAMVLGVKEVNAHRSQGATGMAHIRLMELWKSVGYRNDGRLDALYAELLRVGRQTEVAAVREMPRFRGNERVELAATGDAHALLLDGDRLSLRDLKTAASSWAVAVEPVGSVAVDRLGLVGMSVSILGPAKVWDLETGRCRRTLEGPSDRGDCAVSMTPDGRYGLVAKRGGVLRLWNLEDGRCLRVLDEHAVGGYVDWMVSMTPDATFACSCSRYSSTIQVWDLANFRCVRVISVEDHGWGLVTEVSVAPDGSRGLTIVSRGDGTFSALAYWELETGNCLRLLEGHTSLVTSIALNGDGHLALSGSWDRSVILWDLSSGERLRTITVSRPVHSVALTPDASYAVAALENGEIRCWQLIWDLDFREASG